MCELTAEALGREVLHPETEAQWLEWRRMDVTSTESPCLFGASPYMTAAELYFAKRDQELPFEDTERTVWGRRLQDSIALGILEDNGWKGRRMPEYIRIVGAKMGSSFDWRIWANGESDSADDWLLEIKNVDSLEFKRGWDVTDYGIECPTHIELQCQHQLHTSGLKKIVVGPLIGGNRVHLIERPYYPDVGARIEKAIRGFWKRTTPPPFNFERDFDLIRHLYSKVCDGKVYDATGSQHIEDLMARHASAAEREREAAKEKDVCKAELLATAGDAEKILGRDFVTALGVTRRGAYQVAASEYRTVRVTKKK